MNSAERRWMRFEKLTANNQRREREHLLRRLPSHLAIGERACTRSACELFNPTNGVTYS